MRVLVFISLVGSLLLASCGGSSSKGNANAQEVNPADLRSIYTKCKQHPIK